MFNNGVRIITLISIPRSPPTPGREERGDVCVCERVRKRRLYVVPVAKDLYGLSLG